MIQHGYPKKFNVFDHTRTYEPRLISVGEGWVLQGMDEALVNANIGEKMDVEVPPEKGFGERDKDKVRMVSLRKLGEKADEIKVGDAIEPTEEQKCITENSESPPESPSAIQSKN